jgi:hypothetical protein
MADKSMMSLLSIRDHELLPRHIVSIGALDGGIQEFVPLARDDHDGNPFCINGEIFRDSE